MCHPTIRLRVAADDRIDALDAQGADDDSALRALVLAPGALPLAGAAPGTLLWALFPDERLRQLYRHLVEGVRAGVPAGYEAFGDAAGVRTWTAVRLAPLPGWSVQIEATWQRAAPAPGRAGVEAAAVPPLGPLLRICSWCSRVDSGAAWEEIGAAVARLGLLCRDAPAEVSHGICPDCSAEQSRGI